MKTLLFTALVFFTAQVFSNDPAPPDSPYQASTISGQSEVRQDQEYQDQELQIDDPLMYPLSQEYFARKAFQRQLPTLERKEQVIWAFRIARPSPFL